MIKMHKNKKFTIDDDKLANIAGYKSFKDYLSTLDSNCNDFEINLAEVRNKLANKVGFCSFECFLNNKEEEKEQSDLTVIFNEFLYEYSNDLAKASGYKSLEDYQNSKKYILARISNFESYEDMHKNFKILKLSKKRINKALNNYANNLGFKSLSDYELYVMHELCILQGYKSYDEFYEEKLNEFLEIVNDNN